MVIFFVGGGTLGSVTPLLALLDSIKADQPGAKFFWIGTKNGPERRLVPSDIPFFPLEEAKLDRFFSLRNVSLPFLFLRAFVRAVKIIRKMRPDIIVGAGGFVQVPLMWAAWVLDKSYKSDTSDPGSIPTGVGNYPEGPRQGGAYGAGGAGTSDRTDRSDTSDKADRGGRGRIRLYIHQQDIRPTLSNRLCARIADRITVNFDVSLSAFPQKKTVQTGNPIYRRKATVPDVVQTIEFPDQKPLLVVTGGGTGARQLNELIFQSVPLLREKFNILLFSGGISGRRRGNESSNDRAQDDNKTDRSDKSDKTDTSDRSNRTDRSDPGSTAAGVGNYPEGPRQGGAYGAGGAGTTDRLDSSRGLRVVEFTSDLLSYLKQADIVVTRGGLATLTELSYLEKPTIIIPIPGSHQEDNARYFQAQGSAEYFPLQTYAVGEKEADAFARCVFRLWEHKGRLKELQEHIGALYRPDALEKWKGVVFDEK